MNFLTKTSRTKGWTDRFRLIILGYNSWTFLFLIVHNEIYPAYFKKTDINRSNNNLMVFTFLLKIMHLYYPLLQFYI